MTLGIDIGGTKIAAGTVVNCRITSRSHVLTGASKSEILSQLRTLVASLPSRGRIGIGVPGYFAKTRITQLPNLRALNGVDLKKALSREVILENDATCFTLAEWKLGAGKGASTLVGITLGTGLGSGMVVSGTLLRGAAPEFGHLLWDHSKESYDGRGDGDWEELLSGKNILARHAARGGTETRVSDIFASSTQHARVTQEEVTRHLAIFCANIIRMVNPHVIVIGGGAASRTLVTAVNKKLPLYGCKKILKLSQVKDAGIVGAALLTSLS